MFEEVGETARAVRLVQGARVETEQQRSGVGRRGIGTQRVAHPVGERAVKHGWIGREIGGLKSEVGRFDRGGGKLCR